MKNLTEQVTAPPLSTIPTKITPNISKSDPMFYSYLWLREDGTPYYAGKGSNGRAYRKHGHINAPEDRDRIIVQHFPDEPSAFEAEQFLIAFYGRSDIGTGCLLNRTDGGEGISGPSETTRRAIGNGNRGRKFSESWRRKLREAHLGHKYSAEFSRQMSERMRADPVRMEQCRKLGLSHRGRKLPVGTIEKLRNRKVSDKWRRTISEVNRGNKYNLGRHCSEETKRKIGEANRKALSGRTLPEETRRKMSESHRRRAERRRGGQNQGV